MYNSLSRLRRTLRSSWERLALTSPMISCSTCCKLCSWDSASTSFAVSSCGDRRTGMTNGRRNVFITSWWWNIKHNLLYSRGLYQWIHGINYLLSDVNVSLFMQMCSRCSLLQNLIWTANPQRKPGYCMHLNVKHTGFTSNEMWYIINVQVWCFTCCC